MITKEANIALQYLKNNKGNVALSTAGFGADVGLGGNSIGGSALGMGASIGAWSGANKGLKAVGRSGLWAKALPTISKFTKLVPGPIGKGLKAVGTFGALMGASSVGYNAGSAMGNKVMPIWQKKPQTAPHGFTPEQYAQYEQVINQMRNGTLGT